MLVKELSGLLVLAFIVWTFLAPNPDTRIERVCSPVQWGGNVATSLAALTTPAFELSVQQGMNKLDYGCQYAVWRLFYQKQYNAYLLAKEKQAVPGQTSTVAPAASAPANAANKPRYSLQYPGGLPRG